MNVTAVKTPIVTLGDSLYPILEKNLPRLSEKDIVVVTSKIVSICQKRVKHPAIDKQRLIEKEADQFIDKNRSRYDVTLTVKNGVMIANSGIDESNGNGNLVLWPKNPFKVAAEAWHYLRKKYNLSDLGVLITDTRIVPLRWGTIGVALSWSGFEPLKNYIGEPDIFGHKLRMTKASVIDCLASAADIVMGQGDEQTPLAVISDVPFVEFLDHPPSQKDIDALRIAMEDDLYAPVLTSVAWQKGGSQS